MSDSTQGRSAASSDEQIVLNLIRKLLDESYVDTQAPNGRLRFLIDGSTYDVTQEELDAFNRVFPPEET